MGKGGGGAPGKTLLKEQAAQSKQVFAETTPLRQEQTKQLTELLQTGGITSRIPILQQIIEGSKQAASRGVAGTDEVLATSGLARTPFGAGIRSQARISSEQATSQARANFVQNVLAGVPQYIQGISGPAAAQGLGAAQSLAAQGAQQQAGKAAQTAGIATGAATLGGAGLGAAAGAGLLGATAAGVAGGTALSGAAIGASVAGIIAAVI